MPKTDLHKELIKLKSKSNLNINLDFDPNKIESDRLFFDTMGAAHTFSAMSSYKWNPNTETPKPVHDWASHPCDAVRYAIYTHSKMSNISIYA